MDGRKAEMEDGVVRLVLVQLLVRVAAEVIGVAILAHRRLFPGLPEGLVVAAARPTEESHLQDETAHLDEVDGATGTETGGLCPAQDLGAR